MARGLKVVDITDEMEQVKVVITTTDIALGVAHAPEALDHGEALEHDVGNGGGDDLRVCSSCSGEGRDSKGLKMGSCRDYGCSTVILMCITFRDPAMTLGKVVFRGLDIVRGGHLTGSVVGHLTGSVVGHSVCLILHRPNPSPPGVTWCLSRCGKLVLLSTSSRRHVPIRGGTPFKEDAS